ncbi:MAG: alpha/beta hydrolase, partial [Rhodothermales bacterium]
MPFQRLSPSRTSWLLGLALFFAACSDAPTEAPLPDTERGAVVSASLIERSSAEEVAATLEEAGVPLEARYGVDLYRIAYRTIDAEGAETVPSGALGVPQRDGPMPPMSYQHGTLIEKSRAPSQSGPDVIGLSLSASGYLTAVPDYLGLGESPGLHPYLHAASLSTAVVDFLRAARRFAEQEGIALNEQLFLMGYSEGGYATMAAHRALQEEYADEFEVTASAPLAGPYDLSGSTVDLFLEEKAYPSPFYLPYLIFAYDDVYGLFSDPAHSAAPYADTLAALIDGTHTADEINAVLPSVPQEALRPDFLAAFTSDTDHPLRQAFRANDVYDWTPEVPLQMLHCVGDDQVPFRNAEVALARFQERGAPDVSLVPLEEGGH